MKTIKLILVLICGVALVSFVNPPYDVGDSDSDIKLKNVNDKMVSLSDYKDQKGVIVIFDCNTCPYSKAYNDRIIQLNSKYSSRGFPVITINPNSPEISPGDSFQEMASQAKKKNYTFPYLQDETQQVARSFGATNTPHVFVLKNSGQNFNVAYIGTIDNNSRDASAATKKYVEEAVDALLDSKSVPTTRTKAIGCGIKWKD
jgi:peroxiredoxin